MQSHVEKRRTAIRFRIVWFIALWGLGLGGTFLLALPFEVLMHLAMH